MKKEWFCLMLLALLCAGPSRSQTANPDKHQYIFTVAKDGSGQFKYIQDAIDAMRVYPQKRITLYIKNGVYTEKICLPDTNVDVSFVGESVEKTIIQFDDYSGKGKLTTFNSYTAKISGARFRAYNISFANTAGPVGQAVALHVDADMAMFVNCRFLGNQDTIFTGGNYSRQYFENCYIEGTTDYLFGPATVFFDHCTIRSKSNSYITAASTTEGKKYGYVFRDCNLITDSVVTGLYLGRPWRAFAKTVFINCYMPASIKPEGWHNWGNPENEKTVLYAEYNSTGAGANPTARVPWSKQLTKKEAALYTPEEVLGGITEGNWYRVAPEVFKWPEK